MKKITFTLTKKHIDLAIVVILQKSVIVQSLERQK